MRTERSEKRANELFFFFFALPGTGLAAFHSADPIWRPPSYFCRSFLPLALEFSLWWEHSILTWYSGRFILVLNSCISCSVSLLILDAPSCCWVIRVQTVLSLRSVSLSLRDRLFFLNRLRSTGGSANHRFFWRWFGLSSAASVGRWSCISPTEY